MQDKLKVISNAMKLNFKNKAILGILLSTFGFLLSFFSQIVISYYFGTSLQLDAYWAAMAAINLLSFPFTPIREALVLEIHQRKNNSHDASIYFSKILTLITILAIIGIVICVYFAKELSELVITKSNVLLSSYTVNNLYLLSPAILFAGISEALISILTSFNRAILQMLSRLAASATTFSIIFSLSGLIGTNALIFGFLSGQVIVIVFLLILLKQEGLRFKFIWPAKLGSSFFILSSVLLINFFSSQIYAVYEKYVFSSLSVGLISAFQYGVTLTNAIIAILGVTLTNLLWPRFLGYAKSNNKKTMFQEVSISSRWIFISMAWVCIIIFINASDIVNIIFLRGNFTPESSMRTAQALRATIFSALPIMVSAIIGRALISNSRARDLMLIGLTGAFVGILTLVFALYSMNQNVATLHWFIGNSMGFVVSAILFLRYINVGSKIYLKSLFWGVRYVIVVIMSLYFADYFNIFFNPHNVVIRVIDCTASASAIYIVLLAMSGLMHDLYHDIRFFVSRKYNSY